MPVVSGIGLIDLACKIEGFLSPQACKNLIDFYEDNSDQAARESSTNTMTRAVEESTFTCVRPRDGSLEDTSCKEIFTRCVDEWLTYLQQFNIVDTSELMSMCNTVHHYRILKYVTGSSIHPHTDTASWGYGALLRASCTVNLSDSSEYTGGDFNLLNDRYKIRLSRGDVLIFPASSFWVHSVDPVTSGVRYSLNGFLGPEMDNA